MQKILLIGELGEIVRSVNECLIKDFQIQLCSMQLDMIKGMAKIIKPDLVIVCQIGIDELDKAIFAWLKEQMPKTPVLVITTEESWGDISHCCESEQFDKLFRPVAGSVMVEKCYKMIGHVQLLPEEKEKNTEIQNHKYQSAVDSIDRARKKIMIVDDSPLVLRNMKAMLEEKYNIFLSPSGEKALELIPKKCPDLVLLDYEMPGMDGKEVFEKMLNDGYMQTIPVIFLTSVAQKEQVYGVLKSMPAGYILKPADRNRVLDEIYKVLG